LPNLIELTATEAASAIAQGAISAEDFMRACLERIEAVEPDIGAFTHLDPEHALRQARAADAWRQSGKPIGPLHGVPVAIKDIIDTADYPTECGSAYLAGRRPTTDATVVSRLRAAGAVIIGKTVTTEFAYFSPGKTCNPHNFEHTPGGSSSGSAAAVAAGMVPLALGTQTNGSIIRPASFCGVYGAKPTHGLVPRSGVLPLSHNLDHVGPYANSLDDLALVLDVIAGYDPEDPDSRPLGARDFRRVASEEFSVAPRFAFVRTPVWDKAETYTRDAFEALAKSLGDDCVTFGLPDSFVEAWDALRVIMAADMAHNLCVYADRGGGAVSDVFRKLMAQGRTFSATQYLDAQALARRLRASLNELFQMQFSALITPAAPGIAPKGLGSTGNPMFNTLWSLTGLPTLSLPLLEHDGMPLGVQLVGASNDDARLLRHAAWLVEAVG
jgi:Asp-tRNA(Asn)/Glu-tRNA(Gln) amidotransferase A subunit family amidase